MQRIIMTLKNDLLLCLIKHTHNTHLLCTLDEACLIATTTCY